MSHSEVTAQSILIACMNFLIAADKRLEERQNRLIEKKSRFLWIIKIPKKWALYRAKAGDLREKDWGRGCWESIDYEEIENLMMLADVAIRRGNGKMKVSGKDMRLLKGYWE